MKTAAAGLYPYQSTVPWIPSLKGIAYASGFGSCVPLFPELANCGDNMQAVRMFGVEAMRSLSEAYLANPTPTIKNFLDVYHGAEWCNTAYGPCLNGDGNFVTDCNATAVAINKYPAQCFGIGSAASWSAARLGGVDPLVTFPISQPFSLSVPFAGATKYVMTITAPSGAVSTVTCSTSPCTTTIDSRQGQHIVQGQLGSSNSTLLGQTQLLLVNPS